MTSSPPVVALFAVLYGLGMVAASARMDHRKLKLGRAAVTVGLAGALVSCLAWYLLSWQQQHRIYQQAEYLLDNVRLNAEQVMDSHLTLMLRMAERLDASVGGLEPAVLSRDVDNYLRDTPSLEVIGLLDSHREWRWHQGRSDMAQRWLTEWVDAERVQDWLSMPFPQPRIMVPDDGAPALAIMAIAVPRRDQQLVAVLDMATLLDRELRIQLAGFQVSLSRDDEVLVSLAASGMVARDVSGSSAIASRHIGLPGGPMLSPAVHAGPEANWLQAGIAPSAVGLGG